jgi:hypothetical protein
MKISLSCKCLIIILSFSTISLANDTHIGTITGNVYLEEKADSIQMIKERVYILLQKDSSHVKCTFWLANYGSSKYITIGFPDYHYGVNGTDPVRNFTCKVNGLPIKHIAEVTLQTKYKDWKYSEGKRWYTWKVNIEEKDTIKIENEYDGTWGGTVCENSFHYTIGTGATWAGPIRDGRITFDHSNLVSTNFVIKSRIKGKLQPVYYDDSVVYSFSNYTPDPKEVLSIWIYSTSFFMDYSDLNPCLMRYIESAENAKMVRNEFIALHGYKFDDVKLFNYYRKRKWYKVDPQFDTMDFSNGEKKIIQYLNKKEVSFNKK